MLGEAHNMVKKQLILEKSTFIEKEKILIARCLDGERTAQFELYERYSRRMLNVAYRLLRNKEDAKDVLQDAFVKAFSNLHSYRHQSGFEAWIKRIVINTAINQLKKKGLQIVDNPDLVVNSRADYEQEDHQRLHLDIHLARKALMELPDGYRSVLSLYLLEGYDHQEISEIMGISKSTSLSQFSRGKKKWLEIINNWKQHG